MSLRIIAWVGVWCVGALNAQAPDTGGEAPPTERERASLARIEGLEKRLALLESKVVGTPLADVGVSSASEAVQTNTAADTEKRSPLLGFVPGTTLNFYFDGFYGYNFNRPVGRVNLL